MAPRLIPVGSLEVAVLDRTRTQQRKFRRLTQDDLTAILGDRQEDSHDGSGDGSGGEAGDDAGGGSAQEPPVAPPAD